MSDLRVEVERLRDKWRKVRKDADDCFCDRCMLLTLCADELDAILSPAPAIPCQKHGTGWGAEIAARAEGGDLICTCPPAPAKRPEGCICSEAYGVGPDKCPAHEFVVVVVTSKRRQHFGTKGSKKEARRHDN